MKNYLLEHCLAKNLAQVLGVFLFPNLFASIRLLYLIMVTCPAACWHLLRIDPRLVPIVPAQAQAPDPQPQLDGFFRMNE